MLEIYKDLSWLPEIPKELTDNFSDLIKTADIDLISKISQYKLNDSQAKKIQDRFLEIKKPLKSKKIKEEVKLLILSSNTFDFIIPQLQVSGLRNGISLDITLLPFGNIVSLLSKGIEENKLQEFDYVLLSLDYKGLNIVDDFDIKRKEVFSDAINEIRSIKNIVDNKLNATLIIQSIVKSTESIFGNLESHLTATRNQIINEVNTHLLGMSLDSNTLFFDIEETANKIGLVNWLDHRMYYWAKLPFSADYSGIYSSKFVNLLISDKGLSKKALVLDLDNTLWGGIIGDDGLDGIKASMGDPKGEAFLNFQEYCKRLKSRGIILAVCSKNSLENAILPFRENLDMILKEDDFVVIKANWNNKADNIREIANEINIGLDSIVFVDDNPAERNLVREFLPEVSVPEVPLDVSYYPEIISAAGYFESIRFSKDDIKRAEDYSLNKKRDALREDSTDISEYLRSLNMKAEISEVSSSNLTRPVQLMLKTNQFNLSNKRRTEKEIKKIINDPKFSILQFRLQDRFADNGIVSVVVLEKQEDKIILDTWVMSCRVFGRTLEFYVFNEILKLSAELEIKKISAEYIKTDKNSLVLDLLKSLSFKRVGGNKDSSLWELNPLDYSEVTFHID
jgi:FkbH-like protein